MTAIERQHRVNEQIRVPQVRVILDEGGQQLGILPTAQALATAREQGLDLVEVAPDANPPVCRIMDFGKFKYRVKKRTEKNQAHHSKLKEIRVRPKTDEHDIAVKVNKAREFLQHRDKVLVSVVFRGRELAHIEEGQRVLNHIVELLQDVSKIDSPPRQASKRIECRLSPK